MLINVGKKQEKHPVSLRVTNIKHIMIKKKFINKIKTLNAVYKLITF